MKTKITLDIERENRGFVVDLIELYDSDNSEIGYIKLGYVDPSFYEKYGDSSIVYYVDKMKGWCGVWNYYKNKDLEAFSKTIYNRWKWGFDFGENPDWRYHTNEAFQYIKSKFKEDYQNFKNYFFDKYYVDFVRINKPYRGNGYYIKLYECALELANKQNRPLYTSSLKSDIATERFNKHINSNSIIVSDEESSKSIRQRVIKVNYKK